MKSDVYSLGIIIWEMFTRKIVWTDLSNDEIEFQVRSGERVFIFIEFLIIHENQFNNNNFQF